MAASAAAGGSLEERRLACLGSAPAGSASALSVEAELEADA